MASLSNALATTLPEGAHLVKGAVNIQQVGGDHPVMTIQQQEQIALVEWQAFDIAENASVHVRSGNRESLLINRVVGDTASTIHGTLNADGAVWLVNPNGYLVGERAVIHTPELLFATRDIDPETLFAAATALRTYANVTTSLASASRARTDRAVNVQRAQRGASVRYIPTDDHGFGLQYGMPDVHEVAEDGVADGFADVSSSESGSSEGSPDALEPHGRPAQIRTALAIRAGSIQPIPRPLLVTGTPPGPSPLAQAFMSGDDASATPLPISPLTALPAPAPPPPSPVSSERPSSMFPWSPQPAR